MNTTHTWAAVTVESEGKYLSYVVPISSNENVLHKLKEHTLFNSKMLHANVFTVKKKAEEVVASWNESYKANGTYLFGKNSCC